ncbi:hypothetical protein Y032_0001g425 [Ancylostoma ceylanicum]|uniref:Uncharacterized protein n=1 Tax=Ancylostoma ceylanicum TaxID=53326 RepID=A0A016W486_9BILA|nr:hypothetical protein Y032_0001g425 [Ancylostoma ceylanicum]
MMTWTARKRGCPDRVGGLVVSDRRYVSDGGNVSALSVQIIQFWKKKTNDPSAAGSRGNVDFYALSILCHFSRNHVRTCQRFTFELVRQRVSVSTIVVN